MMFRYTNHAVSVVKHEPAVMAYAAFEYGLVCIGEWVYRHVFLPFLF